MLVGAPASAAEPSVYPELASIKVRPNSPAKPAGTARIAAARNEFEAFQLVVHGGTGGLTNVRASAGALTGPGGATIPASALLLYRVDLLNVTTRSGGIGTTGSWPDPLVPAVDPVDGQPRSAFPFSVQPNQARAIWVDVLVPRDAAPGVYRGQVEVSGTGLSAQVPVELEVWDFELPSTPSLTSAFLAWGPNICLAHTGRSDCGGNAAAGELVTKYARLALDHRITLSNVWVGRDHTSNWPLFDQYFGPLLDGTAPTRLEGARMTSAQITGSRNETAYRSWAQHFRSKGWMERLYDYTADEPPYGSDFADIPPRAEMDARADPDIPVLVTTNIDGAEGYDVLRYLDIIVPVVNHLQPPGDPDQRPRYDPFVAGGGRVWMYQSCMSHGCSGGSFPAGVAWPSYMVDVPAMRNRLMQWANYRYRIQGELYYETVLAYSESPWTSVYMFSGNGDGTLFYPGTPSKIGGSSQVPVASIRLKMIREGVEDFEYLTLLARAGDPALADQVARSVMPTAYSGTDSAAELMAARAQVARRIVELTAPPPPPPPDAGTPEPDAGTTEPDAGTGEPDAGTTDPDAGTGEPDAGTTEPDAGTSEPDAGNPPAPRPDAGASEPPPAEEPPAGSDGDGWSCSAAGRAGSLPATVLVFAGLFAALRRRRRGTAA